MLLNRFYQKLDKLLDVIKFWRRPSWIAIIYRHKTKFNATIAFLTYENLGIGTTSICLYIDYIKSYVQFSMSSHFSGGHLGFIQIRKVPQSCHSGKRWIWIMDALGNTNPSKKAYSTNHLWVHHASPTAGNSTIGDTGGDIVTMTRTAFSTIIMFPRQSFTSPTSPSCRTQSTAGRGSDDSTLNTHACHSTYATSIL